MEYYATIWKNIFELCLLSWWDKMHLLYWSMEKSSCKLKNIVWFSFRFKKSYIHAHLLLGMKKKSIPIRLCVCCYVTFSHLKHSFTLYFLSFWKTKYSHFSKWNNVKQRYTKKTLMIAPASCLYSLSPTPLLVITNVNSPGYIFSHLYSCLNKYEYIQAPAHT